MLNFGRITEVLKEELGEAGAEAVCDAVSFYLRECAVEDMGSAEDEYLLMTLLHAMDCAGLNWALPQYDPLRGCKKRSPPQGTDFF